MTLLVRAEVVAGVSCGESIVDHGDRQFTLDTCLVPTQRKNATIYRLFVRSNKESLHTHYRTLGDLEWEVESTTVTHSSADWWDLLLPLA